MTELEWCAEFERLVRAEGWFICLRCFPNDDCVSYTLERDGARKGIGISWRFVAPAAALTHMSL